MKNKRFRFRTRTIFQLVFFWPAALFFQNCQNGGTDSSAKGALEIGLVCSDLNKSLDFYKNIVGLKETGGFDVEGQFGADCGLSDGKPFTVKLLKLNDSPTATTLKLACCSDSALQAKPAVVHGSPGMKYLTIEVESTKAIKERLQQNGIPLLGKTPVPMGEGVELLMVQDPDGVFVEIIGGSK